jgi:hypothetical protein
LDTAIGPLLPSLNAMLAEIRRPAKRTVSLTYPQIEF